MNRALLHIAALALPLLGLGASWLTTDRASRQGQEWEVPVQGYDPRDFLQGHYVMFQYDWPGLDEGQLGNVTLCLQGTAPKIDKVFRVSDDGSGKPCANYVAAVAPVRGFPNGSTGGRLYTSQDLALRMQQQLADPKLQGVLRFRLRPNGKIVPLGLTFRPRPAEPAQP
ncbi:MAG: GDYXXLXY domain-containing protein [Novosphingobium sp.]|jgi:hypothetical protein|uniref:GDYXXLXY domain-containing protein n=1 Tax=Novosphingobium sp. TaxID=1874826 RepID=UPI0039187DF6|nr:GDYXXLXY domain-containing protein [Novosphingobium sp.]